MAEYNSQVCTPEVCTHSYTVWSDEAEEMRSTLLQTGLSSDALTVVAGSKIDHFEVVSVGSAVQSVSIQGVFQTKLGASDSYTLTLTKREKTTQVVVEMASLGFEKSLWTYASGLILGASDQPTVMPNSDFAKVEILLDNIRSEASSGGGNSYGNY